MTHSDVGFAPAIALIERQGDALERAELAYLLRGTPLPADARRDLLAGQNEDGGWTPPWIDPAVTAYSGVSVTCHRLARAWACGIPLDAPELAATKRFLLERQLGAGGFEEDVAVSALAPDWLKPGDARAAAFVTANPGHPLEAAAAAVCAMGLAGEVAHQRLTPQDGNATYRNYIIDAIYNMTPEQLEKGANYEVR